MPESYIFVQASIWLRTIVNRFRPRRTFDQDYPDAQPDDDPEFDVFMATRTEKCAMCWRQTNFIAVSWESFVCSRACETALWLGFMRASNRSSRNNDPDDNLSL